MKSIYKIILLVSTILGASHVSAQYTKLLYFAGGGGGAYPNGSLFYDGT